MDFHKMPSAALQHLYLASLFASDGRTDGQTSEIYDNHPFGVDKPERILGEGNSGSSLRFMLKTVSFIIFPYCINAN